MTTNVGYVVLSAQPVLYRGEFVIGAKIYVYKAGTNTPASAYSDAEGMALHTWPMLTDANGCIPTFWVSEPSIKVDIQTPTGSIIRTVDGIQGYVAPATGGGTGGGGTGGGTDTTLFPGVLMPAHAVGPQDGWVRANGRSIGNGSSGATERADADTEDLFIHLWNTDIALSVLGGRGTTAQGDYDANKTITLPDYRGRVPVGLTDMGASNSSILNGIGFDQGNSRSIGSYGGDGVVTLTTAQIPIHNHSATTASNGAHTHTGTSDRAGTHIHGLGMGTAGNHNHAAATSIAGVGDHAHSASSSTSIGNAGAHTHSLRRQLSVGSIASTYIKFEGNATTAEDNSGPVNAVGDHSHGASTSTTIAGAGSHSHGASTSIYDAGSHSHDLYIDASPDHQHSFTTQSAGAHTHNITVGNTGTGLYHNNMQPFIMVTWYIKL
jgi:microcystin-dependent protein